MKKSESELKTLIIMEVYILCLIVVWFYNYKIQISKQIHEELKLWQTVKVRLGSQLGFSTTTTFNEKEILSPILSISIHNFIKSQTCNTFLCRPEYNRQVWWKSIQNLLNSGNYLILRSALFQLGLGLCHPRSLKVVVGSRVESRVVALFACHFYNSLLI